MNRLTRTLLLTVLFTLLGVGIANAQYGGIPPTVPITLNNIETPVTLDQVTEMGTQQCALPVVGALPPGVFTTVNISLLNTDFVWTVQVDPDGLFLTNFPIGLFPPGRYYLTVNGTSVTQIDIPDRGGFSCS